MKKTMKNVGIVIIMMIATFALMIIGVLCYNKITDVKEETTGVNGLHWDCSREEFSERVIDVIEKMSDEHNNVELVGYHWADDETHGTIEMIVDGLVHSSYYVFED